MGKTAKQKPLLLIRYMFNFFKTSYLLLVYILLFSSGVMADDAEIPSVYIYTNSKEIGDDYISAQFQLVKENHIIISSDIGIRLRGAFSRTLPKKSFRLEFWADTTGTVTRDVFLLNMRSDDDWNLNAMYNEPLRINTVAANELWQQIHSNNSNLNGKAKNGIETQFVQVYLNNSYHGIYALTERVDRKQLDIDVNTGELYKTFDHSDAALFKKALPYNNQSLVWDGIEWRYPDDFIDWDNLHDFVRFVTTTDNYNFYLNYKSYLDLQNFIDYYIFLNLLALSDNTGKNLFIGKQNKNTPYFYVPWDLDGSFGFDWAGNFTSGTDAVLTNGLFDRLTKDCYGDGFVEHLKIRWEFLRSDIISTSNIFSLMDKHHQRLVSNNIYQKESARWNEYSFSNSLYNQSKQWIEKRIAFLDTYIENLCSDDPTGIPEYNAGKRVSIYPNPARSHFNVKLRTDNAQESIVEIYQLNGQKILTQSFYKDIRISTENFAKGMYIIRILNEDYSATERLLIQ